MFVMVSMLVFFVWKHDECLMFVTDRILPLF